MDKLVETTITCPITKMIFNKPVMALDGILYEETAIMKWFEKSDISPVTIKKMSKTIIPAVAIKNMVNEYLTKYPNKKEDQLIGFANSLRLRLRSSDIFRL